MDTGSLNRTKVTITLDDPDAEGVRIRVGSDKEISILSRYSTTVTLRLLGAAVNQVAKHVEEE